MCINFLKIKLNLESQLANQWLWISNIYKIAKQF